MIYKSLLRPLLFQLDAADAHALGTAALGPIEHFAPLRSMVRSALAPQDPLLSVSRLGLQFASPIGLAGGFDKDAHRPRALAALGFGFLELGTVTAKAQEANPAPNMFRLPADRALVNRLGFPNGGAAAAVERFVAAGGARACGVPIAFSIGKSRVIEVEPIEGAIADYLESFRAVREVADFVVVNVSSPNTKNLRALQGPAVAHALLSAIVAERNGTPILLKIAPDLDDAGVEDLLTVVSEVGLDGVIATNTTIKRTNLRTDDATIESIGAGGLSGPPLRSRARAVVRRVRARLGPKFTVIGVGGIESAHDVLGFIRDGADLVQLYTGFIYGGPGTPHRLARDLATLVRREGVRSIADLVGVAV